MYPRIGALLLASIFLTGCAVSFGYAMRTYNAGNYKSSFSYFSDLASQGDARAERQLGLMYRWGQGVDVDYPKSIAWFTSAANQDDLIAQIQLGQMYAMGLGVIPDKERSSDWYRRAAGHTVRNSQDFNNAVREIIFSRLRYPKSELMSGVGGVILVQFTYMNGMAIDAVVAKSSGNIVLDQAACDAVNNALLPQRPADIANTATFTIGVNYTTD